MINPTARDVEHWIQVYVELCQFKETMLETLIEQRGTVSQEGRIEVAHDDMVLRSEYERLRRRLQYWQLISESSPPPA